jgi:hypothetical protein
MCPGMDKGRLHAYKEIERNLTPELNDF